MPKHDLGPLTQHYPSLIAEMEPEFNSHEFVLKLAHQHQRLYVEALYSYRNSPDPFRSLHAQLGKKLRQFPHLVQYLGGGNSTNIFGKDNTCGEWRKHHPDSN